MARSASMQLELLTTDPPENARILEGFGPIRTPPAPAPPETVPDSQPSFGRTPLLAGPTAHHRPHHRKRSSFGSRLPRSACAVFHRTGDDGEELVDLDGRCFLDGGAINEILLRPSTQA